jgi:hypothetical protein
MSEPDLKKRTKVFALRVLKLVDALPKTTSGRALAAHHHRRVHQHREEARRREVISKRGPG